MTDVQLSNCIPSAIMVSWQVGLILLVLGWLISIIASIRSKKGKALVKALMTLCLIFPPTNPIALLVLLVKDWKRGITPAVCYLLAVVALVALPVGDAQAVTSLILLVLGWLISIIASILPKKGKTLMTLCLIFPPTNPIALLVLLVKDWKRGITPAVCYLLAVVALPVGGAIAKTMEKGRLRAYEQELIDSGETLSVQSLIPDPVSVESNIWAHPYLAPLGVAGQGTKEGEAARTTDRYASMSLPAKDGKIKYVDEGQQSGQPPLRKLHHIALSIVSGRDGVLNESNTPQSWEACGEILVAHFKKAEDDFAQLEEALKRPYDQYPYAWNDGMEMNYPHLGLLGLFAQSAAMRSTAFSTMARSSASFRDAQLAINLIHTGDSDLPLSRRVQMIRAKIALNTLRAAQQFHVWNDEQWSKVQAQLREMDFPGLIPASIRVEAIFMRMQMVEMQKSIVAEFPFILRAVAAPALRAMDGKCWRLALMACFDMISEIETALEKSRTQPWRDCNVGPLPRSLEYYEYGIFWLVPGLERHFQRALNTQTHIELALVACALERYYLANQQYPETLEELVPDYLDASPRDPMTHEPWHYRRDEERGLRLYTVGKNGRDDGGEFERGSNVKDDILWSVEAVTPKLPEFELMSPSELNELEERLEREMREYEHMTIKPRPLAV